MPNKLEIVYLDLTRRCYAEYQVSPILSFKIIILGDSGVGKTTAVIRYVDGNFINTKQTIGVDFLLKQLKLENVDTDVSLQIWDFSGEDRFRSVLPYYIPGANGVMYFFDSTRPSTLLNLSEWHAVVSKYMPPTFPTLIVSTKHDMSTKFDQQTLKNFMSEFGFKHYTPTSAKSGLGVKDAFEKISSLIMSQPG